MNKFEDDIIKKSILTKGNGAEIASLFFQYANNPSCCEGMFDRTYDYCSQESRCSYYTT